MLRITVSEVKEVLDRNNLRLQRGSLFSADKTKVCALGAVAIKLGYNITQDDKNRDVVWETLYAQYGEGYIKGFWIGFDHDLQYPKIADEGYNDGVTVRKALASYF